MTHALTRCIENAAIGHLPDRDAALLLATTAANCQAAILAAAAARRDAAWGRILTWSPKVFLPVTNLCRNVCDYCSFRRSPGQVGAHTMSPAEVFALLRNGAAAGCTEALLCLGDRPESVFTEYRRTLADLGHTSTVSYLDWISRQALECGLFPHTNAGILTREEMEILRRTNVSLGLMLESVAERLCAKGQPHYHARDKHPAVRLRMLATAGELRIPMTSGILIGIGETELERMEALLALRDLHAAHGHIQEVIVQNFRADARTPMARADEPKAHDVALWVALARLVLPDEVSVQAPPNLNPGALHLLIAAGLNDFGGISPVTPDFINRGHPWPQIDELRRICADAGFALEPRLPIYPRWANDPTWVDSDLRARIVRRLSSAA